MTYPGNLYFSGIGMIDELNNPARQYSGAYGII